MKQLEKFKIGFWNYVETGVLDHHSVKDWKDLGMNLAMSFEYDPKKHNKDQMLLVLDECHKENMQVIVCDKRSNFKTYLEYGEEKFRQDLKEAIEEFGHHPAVFGFNVGDEPNENQWQSAINAYIIQQELAPSLVPFINFYPYWAADNFEDTLGVTYDKYGELLDDFVKQTGLKLLSYDCYSHMVDKNSHQEISNYFKNLNLFKNVAEENGIPLWTSLLSVGHWGYRCPNENDFRWQISTSVAHGVTGILWFFLYERALDSNYRVPPIDLFWERTETFEWLSRQNRTFLEYYADKISGLKLQKIYHYLVQYGGTDIFEKGKDEYVDSVDSLYGEPLIISRFVHETTNEQVVVVVNNSQKNPTKATVNFSKPYQSHNVCEWLAPGQMIIIKL